MQTEHDPGGDDGPDLDALIRSLPVAHWWETTDDDEEVGGRRFTFSDDHDQRWTVHVRWGVVAGRVECVSLAITADPPAPVTSAVVRLAERHVRAQRQQHAAALADLLNREDGSIQVDEKRARAWQARPTSERGAPRQDDKWLARAEAMRSAVVAGRPMEDALRDLEPGLADSTYRKIIDRTRKRDAENGWGIAPPARRQR